MTQKPWKDFSFFNGVHVCNDEDLIDLNGTNMLLKKQIIHIIYNELTASGKRGSSNVNNMFCALEY